MVVGGGGEDGARRRSLWVTLLNVKHYIDRVMDVDRAQWPLLRQMISIYCVLLLCTHVHTLSRYTCMYSASDESCMNGVLPYDSCM